ncbi:hypothetical protein RA27_17190 [Ruegeria sp. ANG-R]|uniref:DUF3261 domain-containing protein n=1 Tax=Ruegeria sp. ANG-R TaxID=1577903 RepID=UPI0005805704|nr:DUF3261 domain-containing protein [Ruegeria sp. ANG-R]KIC39797.1 hypothetical protein RA27_17190 [Ruegeria sp. ANG-R]
MRRFLAGLVALVLAACGGPETEVQQGAPVSVLPDEPQVASKQPQPESTQVITVNQLVWPKPPLKLQQKLTLEVDGQTRQAMAFLSLSGEVVEIQLFDPLGLPIGSLKWVNGQAEPNGAKFLPAQISDRHILDDIVLAFWPTEALGPLMRRDLDLKVTSHDRKVSEGLQPLVTVTYSKPSDSTELTIKDQQHGYTLRISSVELS